MNISTTFFIYEFKVLLAIALDIEVSILDCLLKIVHEVFCRHILGPLRFGKPWTDKVETEVLYKNRITETQ